MKPVTYFICSFLLDQPSICITFTDNFSWIKQTAEKGGFNLPHIINHKWFLNPFFVFQFLKSNRKIFISNSKCQKKKSINVHSSNSSDSDHDMKVIPQWFFLDLFFFLLMFSLLFQQPKKKPQKRGRKAISNESSDDSSSDCETSVKKRRQMDSSSCDESHVTNKVITPLSHLLK